MYRIVGRHCGQREDSYEQSCPAEPACEIRGYCEVSLECVSEFRELVRSVVVSHVREGGGGLGSIVSEIMQVSCLVWEPDPQKIEREGKLAGMEVHTGHSVHFHPS